MKIDNKISDYVSNSVHKTEVVVPQVQKEETEKEIRTKQGADIDISLEGYARLHEYEMIENKLKTSMSLETNQQGRTVFVFKDKETGEVIKEIPSEEAQKNYQRVQDFLDRISKDILQPTE